MSLTLTYTIKPEEHGTSSERSVAFIKRRDGLFWGRVKQHFL